MAEHLRAIRSLAERYLLLRRDFYVLHKRELNSAEGNDLVERTRKTLYDIDQYMQQLVNSCDQLITDIEPLVTNISSANNEKLEEVIQLLSARFSIPDDLTKRYLNDFLLVNTSVNDDVDITFDYDVSSNSAFVRNRTTLMKEQQWSLIDDSLTVPADVNTLRDVRKLLDLNREQREKLKQYFDTSTDNQLSVFDLLFNPKITVRYSPRALAHLYLRELGLQNLTSFIEWTTARGTFLRREASLLEEKMQNETRRQKELARLYDEKIRAGLPERERLVREQNALQERVNELRKSVSEKERMLELLREGVKYLGDTNRIALYYGDLEYRVMSNLIDTAEEDETYQKLIRAKKVNTSINPERDLEILRSFEPNTDLKRIERINTDYQEFRKILFEWWRNMLRARPEETQRVRNVLKARATPRRHADSIKDLVSPKKPKGSPI